MDIEVSSPSEQGIDPDGVSAFLDALEGDARLEPHALIVQRHGRRVVEGHWAPHRAGQVRLVYSLSKSFVGAALGLQLGEGRLTLDDLVVDHLPDLSAGVDERTGQMRVRHLASLATGHDREMLLDAFVADPENAVRGFLHLPPAQDPGTLFAYNQPPVLALAMILQRLAGERLVDYLRPRLLDPLGIAELRWAEYQPGVDLGFSGVHTDLDAIARLGQLHLDDGVCGSRRVLPEGWVAQVGRAQIASPTEPEVDWCQGYGFMAWQSRHGYRGDGAFGQLMVVLPEHDTVFALFSGNEEMQALLDHAWTHLLPAMGPDPRPAGPADDRLAERLAGLTRPVAAQRVAAQRVAGGSDDLAGPAPGRFTPATAHLRTHRALTAIDLDGDHLVLHEGTTTPTSVRLPLAVGWTDVDGHPLATSAAVDPEGRLVVDVVPLATPHRVEIVLDPATSTFDASWPAVPLFGGGLGAKLATMVPPP